MKVLSHNVICCPKCSGYPLHFQNVTKKSIEKQSYSEQFLKNVLSRLSYEGLKSAAKELGVQGLPDDLPKEMASSFLEALHTLLREVLVEEGELVCHDCSRVYVIQNKIAKMVLLEDEVEEKERIMKEKFKSAGKRENQNKIL